MTKIFRKILPLTMAVLLLCSWALPAMAETIDVTAFTIDESDPQQTVVIWDSSADAVLRAEAEAGYPATMTIDCKFETAHVVYGDDETPITSYITTQDGVRKINFDLPGAGVYTIREGSAYSLAIYGANMILGNELAMNFYVTRASVDALENKENLSIRVIKTYADGRADVVKDYTFSQWQPYSDTYYRVTFNDISAKEMSDEIFVQIFDGSTAVSDLWVDSVRAYAERTLDAEDEIPEVRTLVVDMLNYGAAAQKQFRYGLNDLANSTLTDEERALATSSVTMESHRIKGQNYYGTNLNLASSISLGLFFRNLTREMTAEVSYTNAIGEAKTFTVSGADFIHYSGSIYRVMVNTLSVKDCGSLVTCTVKDSEGNTVATATDSVEGWVARNTTNTEINGAIMKFAASAAAYEATK